MAERYALWHSLHDADIVSLTSDAEAATATVDCDLPRAAGEGKPTRVQLALAGVYAIYMLGWRRARLVTLGVSDLRGPSQRISDAEIIIGRAAELPLPDCGCPAEQRVTALRIEIDGEQSELESRTVVIVGASLAVTRDGRALALDEFRAIR